MTPLLDGASLLPNLVNDVKCCLVVFATVVAMEDVVVDVDVVVVVDPLPLPSPRSNHVVDAPPHFHLPQSYKNHSVSPPMAMEAIILSCVVGVLFV